MGKLKAYLTQAQDFITDIASRNVVLNDLYQEALETLFNDNKEPLQEAVVLKVFPQNQTAADIAGGKEQYQSAILRIPRLHDCIPDPVRIMKETEDVQQVNNIIELHGAYFSKDPISSVETAADPSSLLKVGDIVSIQVINGIPRIGEVKGRDNDYASLSGLTPTSTGDLFLNTKPVPLSETGKAADQNAAKITSSDQDPNIQSATHLSTNETVKNGQLPSKLLKKWDQQDKEILGGGDVLILADIFDNFLLLANDFQLHFGYALPVTDSYRSYQEQVTVKENKTRQGKPKQAATPGTSKHGWGLAFDYNTKRKLNDGTFGDGGHDGAHYKWLFANAPKRGFHSPPWAQKGGSSPEAWHFEWIKSSEIIKIKNKKLENESE